MPLNPRLYFVAPLAVIVGMTSTTRGTAILRQEACGVAAPESLRISEDSIGPLPLFLPIDRVAAVCPSADTTFVGGGGRQYPAMVVHFPGITAVGIQYRGTRLDRLQPADGWVVFGSGGRLPGNSTLSSDWWYLSAGLGTWQGTNRGVFVVRFCREPRVVFTMNADSAALERMGDPPNMAAVPRSATIRHVLIVSPTLGRAFLPCQR